jgi:catechol 2,3-dioxygenase-like lactoylglutathione lyase family enzyme
MKNDYQVQTLKAHVSLNVNNVENSIEFYQKLFGIEPAKVRVGYAKFDVQNPPLNLALNEDSFKERGGLSHLGIQVASTEDVLVTKSRWEEIGLLTRDEMQTNCCYALQDKTWVRDPDGNEWEVFVVLEDNLTEASPCECGNKLVEEKQEEKIAEACCVSESNPVSINRVSEKSCC